MKSRISKVCALLGVATQLMVPPAGASNFDLEKVNALYSNLLAKEYIYKKAAAESKVACEESKKDLERSKKIQKIVGLVTGPMIVAPVVSGAGYLAVWGIATGTSIAGYGGAALATAGAASPLYITMVRDGKFEKVESNKIPSDAYIIDMRKEIPELGRVSPQMLEQREKVVSRLKAFVDKSIEDRETKKDLNMFNLNGVDRDSALAAIDCYEQEWNKAVAKDFRNRRLQVLQLRAAIYSNEAPTEGKQLGQIGTSTKSSKDTPTHTNRQGEDGQRRVVELPSDDGAQE